MNSLLVASLILVAFMMGLGLGLCLSVSLKWKKQVPDDTIE